MKKHLSKYELINALLDTSDSSQKRAAARHISRCDFCKNEYESLKTLLSESENTELSPAEYLEKRISASYQETENRNSSGSSLKTLQEKFRNIPMKHAAGFAAALTVIIIAFLFLLKGEKGRMTSLINRVESISLTAHYGTININGKPAEGSAIIGEGVILESDTDTMADISFRNIFRIRLSGRTTLKIEKAEYNTKKNVYQFQFNLKRGTLYSHFSHTGKGLDYSFITSHSEVKSIGTEFALIASDEKTVLLLTEGKVQITSQSTGKKILSTVNHKYTIMRTIQAEAFNSEDQNFISSLTGKAKKPGITQTKNEKIKHDTPSHNEMNVDSKDKNASKKSQGRLKERSKLREAKRELRESKKEIRMMKRSRKK